MAEHMQTMIDSLNEIYNKMSEKEAEVIMDVQGKPGGCIHMCMWAVSHMLPVGRVQIMHSPGIWSSTRIRSWPSMWTARSWMYP